MKREGPDNQFLSKLKTVKALTEKILKERPLAREDDKLLLWYAMKEYGIDVPLDKWLQIPSAESFRRSRQIIQNEEQKYLPGTDVEKRRKDAEKTWESFSGGEK